MLKQQLKEELKQSMLSKNAEKTSVLRLLLSAIGYFEIQKGGAGYEASDEDVLAVISKEIKQRKESIEQFNNTGRKELADKETKEMEYLQMYLPAQMTEDEVRSIVEDAMKEMNPTGEQDFGKVMAVLMPKVKGKADGGIVSKIVKELLSKNS